MSFILYGNQVVTPYSRCVLTSDLYSKLKHSQSSFGEWIHLVGS